MSGKGANPLIVTAELPPFATPGSRIDVTVSTMGGVKVDNANVVKTDIVADNGVIHVIDSVVMPK